MNHNTHAFGPIEYIAQSHPATRKNMKKLIHSVALAMVALTVMLGLPAAGFAQVAGVIGVKFGFTAASGYATPDNLAPTDAAGILVAGALAVTNWNNLLTGTSPSLSASINTPWNIAQD